MVNRYKVDVFHQKNHLFLFMEGNSEILFVNKIEGTKKSNLKTLKWALRERDLKYNKVKAINTIRMNKVVEYFENNK